MGPENSNQIPTSEIESQHIAPVEKKCKYCIKQIPTEAKVCSHCHRDQNWFLYRFRIEHIGLLITLGIMVFSYLQFHEARKERVSASKALQAAEQAKFSAQSTSEEMKKLSKDMNTLYVDARTRADQIENITRETKLALDDLKSFNDFTLILEKARNDDRPSFDTLIRIAKSNNKRFSQVADKALLQILTSTHVENLFMTGVDWQKYTLDPEKASFGDFTIVYNSEIPYTQVRILYAIWNQKRFSKYDKITFLINVIKATTSIRCLHQACKLLDVEAKIGRNFIGYTEFLQWWEKQISCYRERDKPC